MASKIKEDLVNKVAQDTISDGLASGGKVALKRPSPAADELGDGA